MPLIHENRPRPSLLHLARLFRRRDAFMMTRRPARYRRQAWAASKEARLCRIGNAQNQLAIANREISANNISVGITIGRCIDDYRASNSKSAGRDGHSLRQMAVMLIVGFSAKSMLASQAYRRQESH